MWRQVALGTGAVMLTVVVLWGLFTVAMRTRFRPVQDAIRRMNRATLNPRTMRTAGQRGAYASVVHHVGRTSGAPYATPIVARPTGDGFIVALPYGTRADWLKNVLAAGAATIDHDGGTYRVTRPEVVATATVDRHFRGGERRNHRLYGVDQALVVTAGRPPAGGTPAAAG